MGMKRYLQLFSTLRSKKDALRETDTEDDILLLVYYISLYLWCNSGCTVAVGAAGDSPTIELLSLASVWPQDVWKASIELRVRTAKNRNTLSERNSLARRRSGATKRRRGIKRRKRERKKKRERGRKKAEHLWRDFLNPKNNSRLCVEILGMRKIW